MKYELVVNVDIVFIAILVLIALAVYFLIRVARWCVDAKYDILNLCSPPKIEVTNLESMTSCISKTDSIEKAKYYLAKADLAHAEADLMRATAANERCRLAPFKSSCAGDGSDKTSS